MVPGVRYGLWLLMVSHMPGCRTSTVLQGAAWQLPDVCCEKLDVLHVVSELSIEIVLWY